jgi:SAM-dependent methyltransferase
MLQVDGGLCRLRLRPVPTPAVSYGDRASPSRSSGQLSKSKRAAARPPHVPSPAVTDDLVLPGSGLIEDLPSRELVRGLFHLLFGREPDDDSYVQMLESGSISPRQLVEWLVDSAEWSHAAPMTEFGPSLHYGRGVFIRTLPRARRILDIGGAARGDPNGALVLMGYPYAFDELVIVDLPSEERHPLYQDESRSSSVESSRGLVTYRYHSMTDLSSYGPSTFDLVYSGQSIEHVFRHEADCTLSQVRRVLKPGGYLAIDTPNSKLTRLQQDAYIDPDHKYEFSHREMAALLRGNGFVIEQALGINYGGESVARGAFDEQEVATKRGLFHEISDCYLLSYVCRRPASPRIGTELNRLIWKVASPNSTLNRALRRVRSLLIDHGKYFA